MYIDKTTYNKALDKPIGSGYDARPNGRQPTSLVIHTTNGNRGSSFAGEANYLYASSSVSAHFLVGQLGEIAMILHPKWRAWHAGAALVDFNNANSIGIECHHAVGDTWTNVQRTALTWLTSSLLAEFNISPRMVETHRKVATPAGRKQDPSDWNDEDFYRWQKSLGTGVDPLFINAYEISGGVWKPNQLTPGYPITQAFELRGQTIQLFERAGARYDPKTRNVSWLLHQEFQEALSVWQTSR